jgi:hypothetical protein
VTRFELYKDAYDKEIDRRKSIEKDFTLPITLITGLIAWLFYFYTKYYLKADPNIWIKFLLLFSLCSLFIAILYLTISYFFISFSKNPPHIISHYDYFYLEKMKVYETFYKERLIQYNESNLLSPKSDKELKEHIIEQFLSITDHNIEVNNRKVARLTKAKAFLVINLILNFLLLFSSVLDGLFK